MGIPAIKRSLIIFGFAGSLLAFQPHDVEQISESADKSVKYRDLVVALRNDPREIKQGRQLRVKLSEKDRLIVPNKCEMEGVAELYKLTSSGEAEESYIFIPQYCLWIEVGYSQTRVRSRLDQKFIDAVTSQFSRSVIYHVHLIGAKQLESFFPAYKDLISLVLINSGHILNPNFDVRHKIVTTLGIMEYEFSDKNDVRDWITSYKNSGLHPFEAQNLAYQYMGSRHRNSYLSEVRKCKEYNGTIKQQLIRCSPVRTKAFTVTFQPKAIAPR